MGIALFHTGIRLRNTANLGNECADNRLRRKEENVLIKNRAFFYFLFYYLARTRKLIKNSHIYRKMPDCMYRPFLSIKKHRTSNTNGKY